MLLRKYNWKEKKYELYQTPEEWKVSLYEHDLWTKISCCQCGRDVLYGDCYTSMEVHNAVGLGYAVCPECYLEELKRRKESKENES